MLRLGVLISGRGSNLQAMIDACAVAGFPAQIVLVLSNKPDVQGLERAKAAHIPTAIVHHRDYDGREAFEKAVDAELRQAGVELVCLAGFMRILTRWFVEQWHDRMINIHPSLLPAFPGVDTHQRALDAGVRFTGCTVHYVRPDVDAGPIILQSVVPVLPDDTEEVLAARVLQAEHVAYPAALRFVAEKRVTIVEDHTVIAGAVAPQAFWQNPQ
jgi:phosphoribosylglycinamide formyltransferase-1